MRKQFSYTAYRSIDLLLFAAILCFFEGIIIRVSASFLFYDQMFTVSLAAPIAAIVLMRWGWWGGIHAALAGFVYCLLSGGNASQFLIYMIGNLGALAMVPVLQKVGPEKMRNSRWLYLIWGAGVQVMMHLGRAVVSLFFGVSPLSALAFFTMDPLSYVFTLVILWIVKRVDGVFEEQKHYLVRLQKQLAKEQAEFPEEQEEIY